MAGDEQLGRLNARYSAPELFQRRIGRACDQYSLALIYQEMLTGYHPERNQRTRAGGPRHRARKFDLDPLPAPDRTIIARALDPDPERRFPTCAELINALEEASPGRDLAAKAFADKSSSAIVVAEPSVWTASAMGVPAARETLSELVKSAAGPVQVHERGNFRFLLHDNEVPEYRCVARVLRESARLKLEGFQHEWKARLVRREGDDLYVFAVILAGGFWQRCLRSGPELLIEVRFAHPLRALALTEVAVQIRSARSSKALGPQALQEIGASILASLRSYLQPNPESRTQERFSYHRPVLVRPVFADRSVGEPPTVNARTFRSAA